MKRTLLLLPAIAIILLGCPARHATSNDAPPAPGKPDPNGYTMPAPGNSSSGSNSGSGSSYNTGNTDTVVTNVSMPNGNNGTSNVSNAGGTTQPQTGNEIKVDSSKLCRLVVSFTSKGSGIDYDTQNHFDKWLAKDNKGGFTYTKTPWGREGEVNYCFDLSAKSRADQAIFVKEVREVIGEKDRVFVNEWAECAKGHQASEVTPAPLDPLRDTTKERLVVSFLSRGDGIDAGAQKSLDQYLAKHPDIKFKVIQWGREGEMDYVLMINGRAAAEQEKIVKEVRDVIGVNERVFVEENKVPHGADPVITHELNPDETGNLPQRDTSNTVRLVVTFISKGQGIDHKTQDEFEKWLAERPQYTYEKTSWGREGEVNYCFRLTNIDGRQQEVFIRDVRTFMTGKDMVFVSEWDKCDKRK